MVNKMMYIFSIFLGFTVTSARTCSNLVWDIRWTTKPGDQPNMLISKGGSDIEATVTALTHGGLWLRPIRADMLRLPETQPQV